MLQLKAECEEWLVEHADPHTCVDCLLYAQQYRCEALEAAAKRMLVREFEAVALTESLTRLPAPLLAEVIPPASPLHLPYTPPTSPLHLPYVFPYISPISPQALGQDDLFVSSEEAVFQAVARWLELQPAPVAPETAASLLSQAEISARYRGDVVEI